MATAVELAKKMEGKVGRYDIAHKVEVRAFVEVRLAEQALRFAKQLEENETWIADLCALIAQQRADAERRLHELELGRWGRFQRWARALIDRART